MVPLDVDDIFVILKKDMMGELLAHLNTQHGRIEFTLEEREWSLPFLCKGAQTGRGNHADRGVMVSDAYRQLCMYVCMYVCMY